MRPRADSFEDEAGSNVLANAHLVRSIAETLATGLPIGELMAQCCVPIALLADAHDVRFAIRDGQRERTVYAWRDAFGSPPADDGVDPDSATARTFATGRTQVEPGGNGTSIAVPIRFGVALLGVLAVEGATEAPETVPLLEACALHIGARIFYENTLRSSERFAALAFTDGLTAVANRRKFDEALAREWSHAARERLPLTLLIIDIDFFKDFNDGYGHHAGDMCLQHVARALADGVKRPTDLFARYGGEEFVALLPGTGLEGGTALAEAMRAAVAALRISHGGSSLGHLSLSIGVASCIPGTDESASDLVRAADASLYAAKTAGRNRVIADGYASRTVAARRVQTSTPNNLPLRTARLVGRPTEVAAVKSLLERSRLVTVAGPAGSGKTRIALQAATESLDAFPDGVWYVDLAAVSDPDAIEGAMLAVVDRRATALTEALAGKRALLVIHGGDHLGRPLAALASDLLRTCGGVRILCASRRRLGVANERAYELPRMPVPPANVIATASDAATYESVALFVERAKVTSPGYVFGDADAKAAAAICRLAQGNALAIELAAARLSTLGATALAERLEARIRGAGNDVLGAFIAWSCEMLAPPELRLLQRLTGLAGRWRLDAAIDLGVREGLDADGVIAAVANLQRAALIVDDPGTGGESAYRMVAPIRDFAGVAAGAD